MTNIHTVVLLASLVSIGLSSWESWILGLDKNETQQAVARVKQVFQEISSSSTNGEVPRRTYHLIEADLNAFLLQKLSEQPHPGVDSVILRLFQNRIVALVQVDMDKLRVETNITTNLFLSFFNGKQTLKLEGQLKVEDGRGRYILQRTEMNDIEISSSVVGAVLTALGREHNPPFDLNSFFEMPYGIKAIDIQLGQAAIRTGS